MNAAEIHLDVIEHITTSILSFGVVDMLDSFPIPPPYSGARVAPDGHLHEPAGLGVHRSWPPRSCHSPLPPGKQPKNATHTAKTNHDE
jgi:hypothetical protein